MSGTLKINPNGYTLIGNLLPESISNPTGTGHLTTNNCTVTLESAVTVDGHLLKPILYESGFPS